MMNEIDIKKEIEASREGVFVSLDNMKILLISKIQPPIEGELFEFRHRSVGLIQHPTEDAFLVIKEWYGITFPGWGVEENESLEQSTIREIQEETGYVSFLWIKKTDIVLHNYRRHEEKNRLSINHLVIGKLADLTTIASEFEIFRVQRSQLEGILTTEASKLLRKAYLTHEHNICPK